MRAIATVSSASTTSSIARIPPGSARHRSRIVHVLPHTVSSTGQRAVTDFGTPGSLRPWDTSRPGTIPRVHDALTALLAVVIVAGLVAMAYTVADVVPRWVGGLGLVAILVSAAALNVLHPPPRG